MNVDGGSSLQLGNSSLSITAEQFSVSDQTSSTPLLSVSGEGVSIGSASLDVTGSLGVAISGPLETGRVQSPSNQDLQVQSLSGELQLVGGHGISLQDGPGFEGVAISSNSDLTITSQNGQVRHFVEFAKDVFLRGAIVLQVVLDSVTIALQGVPRTGQSDTYEVCVCGTQGTLYLVPASSNCQEDNGICTS